MGLVRCGIYEVDLLDKHTIGTASLNPMKLQKSSTGLGERITWNHKELLI